MERKRFEVVVAGMGGQGILTVGKLLLQAGISKYDHAFYLPQYGTERRGGKVQCTAILAESEMDAQPRLHPPAAIVMTGDALRGIESRIEPGGTILLDSTLIPDEVNRKDLKVIRIPATKYAQDMGDRQSANFILFGAYLEATKAVPLELVEEALEVKSGEGRKGTLLNINKEALRQGARLMANYRG